MNGEPASRDLTDVPARDWQKARRRLGVIRDLAELTDRTRDDAEAAAAELDLSLSQLYRLLARYQADPRLTSLLPEPPGRKTGWIKLSPEVNEIINAAIDEYYLSRRKPRVSDLLIEVRRRCRALGYPAPGRKAVRLRLAQRPAAQVTARRSGRKAARDRFGAAAGSFEARWPLSLVSEELRAMAARERLRHRRARLTARTGGPEDRERHLDSFRPTPEHPGENAQPLITSVRCAAERHGVQAFGRDRRRPATVP